MRTADAQMQENTPSSLMARLESVFSVIHQQRMADMPLLNPALCVEAAAFAPWRENWVGVLITPWFMNLMLLPQQGHVWRDVVTGQTIVHTFPSGDYAFITGHEPALGCYQSCSLFSPMFEFPDQANARATAVAAMSNLFTARTVTQDPVSLMSRRAFLGGSVARGKPGGG